MEWKCCVPWSGLYGGNAWLWCLYGGIAVVVVCDFVTQVVMGGSFCQFECQYGCQCDCQYDANTRVVQSTNCACPLCKWYFHHYYSLTRSYETPFLGFTISPFAPPSLPTPKITVLLLCK
jgi:hypothetical protein